MSDVSKETSATDSSMSASNHQQTSPQLLKQLTSPPVSSTSSFAALVNAGQGGSNMPYILTPSVSGRSSPSGSPSPARKKLKLDVEAANVESDCGNKRRSLFERRQVKLKSVSDDYKNNMSEMFCLQYESNFADVHSYLRKPNSMFLTFLSTSNAPATVIHDIKSRVLGPPILTPLPAPSEQTPASPTPKSVTSAAMAAAMMARAAATGTPLIPAQRHMHQPYIPRAVLMSPIRVGENLQAYSGLGPSLPGSMTPRRGSIFRDQISEKVKQEAWVVKRVNELSREGLWSEKRLPKVCERPRARTQWDVLLQEMRWLAVDFYQERQWKKAAAKMLAESAKTYVDTIVERRAKAREAKERRLRRVAGFVSNQVQSFWSNAAVEALVASAGSVVNVESLSNHVDGSSETHSEENPSSKRLNCDAEPNSDVKKCDGLNDEQLMDLNFKRSRTTFNKLKSKFVQSSGDLKPLDEVDVDDGEFSCDVDESDDDDESTIADQVCFISTSIGLDVQIRF